MNELMRHIYINVLKHGDRYKTVDKVGHDVYIEYYRKDPFSKKHKLSGNFMLRPNNTGR